MFCLFNLLISFLSCASPEKFPDFNEEEEASSATSGEEDECPSTDMDHIHPDMDTSVSSESLPAATLPIQG